jgi:ankyrin repeat protein
LCNTKHSLDTFWFLLQVCRDLLEAAKSGDVKSAKSLVGCKNDRCTTDDERRSTPLIYAAIFGQLEVVRVLLEGGANVESTNANQQTALHEAAFRGHVDMCRLLLDWGAKVDHVDKWKETPLQDAAWMGHLSVVKLLVERGADVRLRDENGRTASDMARSGGKRDVVQWLDSVRRG